MSNRAPIPSVQPFEAPFLRLHPGAGGRILLVADHASQAIPLEYGSLGLSQASFVRHIAYDLGVRELAGALANELAAPAILAGFSRLLIDPNRGEDDPTLVMRLSDGEIIPGNAKADDEEVARRIARFYRPYHGAIDDALDRVIASGHAPLLISLHSFTPLWRGRARPWHCGILWSKDETTAHFLLRELRAERGLVVGDNEPYSGRLEGDCMDRHGTKRGIAHALIEVRQDLLSSPSGVREWSMRLARTLKALASRPEVQKENAHGSR